jgi:hypothetical protein
MPSPFPGMDPFIEGQQWGDFHHSFTEEIRRVLIPQVVPRYLVRVDEYVYIDYICLTVCEPETLEVVTVIELLSRQ